MNIKKRKLLTFFKANEVNYERNTVHIKSLVIFLPKCVCITYIISVPMQSLAYHLFAFVRITQKPVTVLEFLD